MKKKPLEIDMIAGSQLRDTQGEMLSVEGADISDLVMGRGRINDNHGRGFYNAIGRVTTAKKIFKKEDCENDRHRYYWDKVKAPYIYVKAILFDDEDHPNAKAAAAILRNVHKSDTPLKIKASVEGGVLSRGVGDQSLLARTKIHSVALTFTPANNATLVEPTSLDKSNSDDIADMILIKSVAHLAETNIPSFRHITRDASAAKVLDNIDKINEIRSQLGLSKANIASFSKEELIKNSVEEKVLNNVKKINELIAQLSQKKTLISQEELTKASKKQLKQMIPNSDETVDWISKNIKRDDLAVWFAREYKKDPSILNDKTKEELKHHISIANNFNSDLRLGKGHDFKTGMEALEKDGQELSKKHAEKHSLVEPDGEKFLDLGNGKAWYSLGKGSCSNEAKAMGHCGNEPSEVKGDNILSLRQQVTSPDGKTLHKPLITAIENGGYLGETKGQANTKPKDKEAMAALLKDSRIKGNIGGGWEPEKNFNFDDLDEKDKQELEHKHTNLFHNTKDAPDDLSSNPRFGDHAKKHNQSVQLLRMLQQDPNTDISTLPRQLEEALMMHKQTPKQTINKIYNSYVADHEKSKKDPRAKDLMSSVLESPYINPHAYEKAQFHPEDDVRLRSVESPHFKEEHFHNAFNDDDRYVRAAAVRSAHFKPEHMRQALDDEYGDVRHAAVESPHFNSQYMNEALSDQDPAIQVAAIRSPHFGPEHMWDGALNYKSERTRGAIVKSPHFDPKNLDRAMNDKDPYVRQQVVASPHFKPEHMDWAMNDKDPNVRQQVIESPHFKPEHMDWALSDKDDSVRRQAIRSPHFGSEYIDKALSDPDEHNRSLAAQSKLTQKQFEQAFNEGGQVRSRAMNSSPEHFKPEHMNAALSDNDNHVRQQAVRSPHFKPEHMDLAMNDKDPNVRQSAVESPHATPGHINQALNDKDEFVRKAAQSVMQNNTNKANKLDKALTAGYGGAGSPTSMTGGSVIQSESLNLPKSFKYVTCDDCGKEQIHHTHQVKCRSCNKAFSLEKLCKLMTGV